MNTKIWSLICLISLLLVLPLPFYEKSHAKEKDIDSLLNNETLKSWRDYLSTHRSTVVENDYKTLLKSTPDRLVVVPLEPEFAMTAQEILFGGKVSEAKPQQNNEKILVVSYTLKYGQPLWWGIAFFGRPSSPPVHYTLEIKIRLCLVDTSDESHIWYPELIQKSDTGKGNTHRRESTVKELFARITESSNIGDSSIKKMIEEAQDIVLQVGTIIDGGTIKVSEDLRRRIALKEIRESDPRLRRRGAKALIPVMKKEDADILMDLLDDEDRDVRGETVRTIDLQIDKISPEGIREALVPVLSKALLDSTSYVRMEAAKAIPKTNSTAALEPLIATARDTNPEVRKNVADSLGILGNEKAIRPLIEMLDDEKAEIALKVAASLGKLRWRPPDVELRVKYLLAQDKPEEIVCLGKTSIPVLIEVLSWKKPERVEKAIHVLGNIKDANAVEPLMPMLVNENTRVRSAAAKALGNLKDSRAVIPLISCLGEKDQTLRAAAAEALGKIGDDQAAKPLQPLLKDKDEPVRRAAAEALRKLNWQPEVPEQKIRMLLSAKNSEEILKMGYAAVKPLVAILTSDSKESRVEVIRILGRIGPNAKGAVIPICASLISESESERIAAAEALALIGDSTAAEYISRALESQKKSDAVSLSYRFALVQLGQNRTEHIAAILEAFSSDAGERALALIVRIDLSAEDQELLFKRLDHSDPKTRIRAAKAISQTRLPGSSNRLWKRLAEERDETVREALREAIRNATSNK